MLSLSCDLLLSFDPHLPTLRCKDMLRLRRRSAIKWANSSYIVCHIHCLIGILLHWTTIFRWIEICLDVWQSGSRWCNDSHQSFIFFRITCMCECLKLADVRCFKIFCQYRIALLDIPWWQIYSVRWNLFNDSILVILMSWEYSLCLTRCTDSTYSLLRIINCVVSTSLRKLEIVHSVSLPWSKSTNLWWCTTHTDPRRITLFSNKWVLSHASTKILSNGL